MSFQRGPGARSAAVAVAVVVAATAYAWIFHDKGIVMGEEGQILAEAEAILNGRVLYRDIEGFVAPGVWYLAAATLWIAGPDLVATRLVMVALFAATALLVYLLTERVTSRRVGLLAVVLLFVQKALAFPLGVFLFYTEFALFFALGVVYALLRTTDRDGERWAFVAGLCLASCALFKQNIGAVILVASLAYLARFERRRSVIVPVLAVPAVGGLGVLLAFSAVGALPALVNGLAGTGLAGFARSFSIPYSDAFSVTWDFRQLLYHTPGLFVEEFVLGEQQGTRWLLEPPVRVLSTFLYLVPLLVAVVSVVNVAAKRPETRIRLLLWAGALATFAGVFPRSDFPHIVQGLVGFLPIGLYELQELPSRRGVRVVGLSIASLLVAFAATLVVNLPHRERFEHPRARLWLSPGTARAVSTSLGWIEETVPPGDRLAVLPGAPMYYFLSGREAPLRFTYILANNVGADGGRAVAEELERKRVDWVLFGEILMPGVPPFEEYAPALSKSLQVRFEAARTLGEGQDSPALLRRRVDPSGGGSHAR